MSASERAAAVLEAASGLPQYRTFGDTTIGIHAVVEHGPKAVALFASAERDGHLLSNDPHHVVVNPPLYLDGVYDPVGCLARTVYEAI